MAKEKVLGKLRTPTHTTSQQPAKTIDCVGLYCPEPLFKARQGIEEIEVNEILELQADDPAAKEDIKRFCKRTGHMLIDLREHGGVFTFLIKRIR